MMARSQEPLLRRTSTEGNNEGDIGDEDALLNKPAAIEQPPSSKRVWLQAGLSVWAVLATVATIVLAVLFAQAQDKNHRSAIPSGKRNLIFMVSDGMGPTSLALTRSFRQYSDGLPFDETLVLDQYEIGKSRTRSSNSLVTDSAAGATAFSCGMKSYNGAISTLPDHTPCGTVLEAAKRAGYLTGLVVTTRITDATPACFAAHVNTRAEEDRIAEQLLGDYPLGRTVDLMLGAGRCHFLPNGTEGSCRADDKDLIATAKERGYTYVGDRKEFDNLNFGTSVKLPLLGLFADQDIPYEIDRKFEDDIYPSLQDLTVTALGALKAASKDNAKGFFLMVEGSRIDHAGHTNDPAAQVHEVLAYDRAFQVVTEFVEKESTQSLLLATSDHETGGLATARQLSAFAYPEYRWFPSVLANASHSVSWVSREFAAYLRRDPTVFDGSFSKGDHEGAKFSEELHVRGAADWLREAIKKHLGIYDVTDDEIELLLNMSLEFTPWILADMISRRAQTGWSTHGHSGADVNIYASDADVARPLVGNHENTEIGEFMRRYLDVDTNAVTKELVKRTPDWDLKAAGGSWMGAKAAGDDADKGNHLDRYQGQFRRHVH